MHIVCGFVPTYVLMLLTCPSHTTTISPGSRLRSNSAPTLSSAQVSEANTIASPRLPIQSGRKPHGSRAAMSLRGLITISENAPFKCGTALSTAASMLPQLSLSFAIVYAIISVSVVVWKIAPVTLSSSISAPLFTRLPLCAIAILPLL